MEMNSPGWTSRDTPRSAGTTTLPRVYSLVTSLMETMGEEALAETGGWVMAGRVSSAGRGSHRSTGASTARQYE